ncbi:MAG: hypothetical protein HYS13_18745 [Planctomycetia bacterium]|nr:hypothetical protein [Planctomycetia bacterium]
MSFLRFTLLGLLAVVTFMGVACAALASAARVYTTGSTAGQWWECSIATLSLGMLAACLLGTFFSTGPSRTRWGGAAAAGIVYFVIIFTSWPGDSVRSKVITCRLFAWAEQAIQNAAAPANQGSPAGAYWIVDAYGNPSPYYVGSGIVTAPTGGTWGGSGTGMPGMPAGGMAPGVYPGVYLSPPVPSGYAFSTSPQVSPGPPTTPFQGIAHYLTLWPLALLGGVLAQWLSWRSRRPRPASEIPPPHPIATTAAPTAVEIVGNAASPEATKQGTP